jgi:membrane fusion protein, multidrug efflux system
MSPSVHTPLRRLLLAFSLPVVVAWACSRSSGAKTDGDSSATASDSSGENSGAPRLALPVAAAKVREGDLVLTVTTTGQVRSESEATLKAEVAGTVDRVFVRAGDRVHKGDSLIALDPRPLDLAVEQAQAAVAEAQVRYRDSYFPDSFVTGRMPSEEQQRIFRARSGLQSAQVALEQKKLDRERASVLAPFDGMVDRVDVAPGMRIGAGELVTRVVSVAQLRVEASVLEHDLPLIKEGGEAIVTSSAAPDHPIIGRIAAVLPMVDTTTRSGRAYVRIPPNTVLRPGMYADVRLEANRLTHRRLVPTRAIIERDGRPLVFVVKDGRAQWVYVNPGRSNGTDTEILPDSASGVIPVQVGDLVVVEGHLTLTHDAPVRVVSPDTATGSVGVKKE